MGDPFMEIGIFFVKLMPKTLATAFKVHPFNVARENS